MNDKRLHKRVIERVGRLFAMMINRALMYHMTHPFTIQSMFEFFKGISSELNVYTPIVVIMHQDAFFIEDEPLDPRLNTSKIVAHFKKAGIQSVSFDQGLTREGLTDFLSIIVDLTRYPNADLMKAACERANIVTPRVNHVFFKKVTVDEEVLSRDEIKGIAEKRQAVKHKNMKEELLDMISGGIALENFGKSLSITDFLMQPERISDYLNAPDSETLDFEDKDLSPGGILLDQIHKIRLDVDNVAMDLKGAKLHELADSVAQMRDQLVRGILEKKKNGIVYENEIQIISEAKELTDNVVLQIVRDEYKQGAISINRLSQVLRRLVPDNDELQRILPKLKDILLIEGMSLKDFLALTDELEKEISNKAITGSLKKSAESIGVSGDDLLREITSNPTEAAELIYLATEIRKGSGDKKALTDLLVDYIERISGGIAYESATTQDEGSAHLKTVITRIEKEMLDRLKMKNMDSGVMDAVIDRLNTRIDTFIEKLEVNYSKRLTTIGTWDSETTSLIKLLEENVGDSEQLKNLLRRVKDTVQDKTTGEYNVDALKFDLEDTKNISESLKEPAVGKLISLPKGVHNRKNILYFIEMEMLRAVRYQTMFSVVTFSILKAVPQMKYAAGTLSREDITHAVLEILMKVIRETDFVGLLDPKKIIALMPMTGEEDAKLALRRLLKGIHSNLINVNGVTIEVKFVGAVTPFDVRHTPSLKEFILKAERDIFDMVQRIKNLQTLY